MLHKFDQKTLAQIVDELLEIRGDKDFREIIEKLVQVAACAPSQETLVKLA